ncbi:MAG: magnesium transporter [Lentisphaerae bacterium]|nr:magnesium transporter [Lentisphaerota bacterium]
MKNPLLVPEIRELIENNDTATLRELGTVAHPVDVADFISPLEPEEIWMVLRNIDQPLRSEIFSHLERELQVDVVENLNRQDIVNLFTDMTPDDRVDLFKNMPEDEREALLPAMAHSEREDIRRLAAYEEGTAGSIMTPDYATLSPEMTATQAIDRLREVAPDKETIYCAYVLDQARNLLGFVSLKDLIVARRDATIKSIMRKEPVFVSVDEDQEQAARQMQKYDMIAMPVLNEAGAMVGIITHDDASDVLLQEQTEDIEKLMAIGGSHEAGVYLRLSAWGHFKNRAVWLIILAILGLISGFVVQSFEGLLMQFAILAVFMPMLADTGGNTGSQSVTLVIRALALNEITPRDIFRVLLKEAKVSVMLGITLGLLAFGRVMLYHWTGNFPDGHSVYLMGLAIGLALGLQVVTSTLIGVLLPLGAARLKLDPAVIASPTLTTVVDITGLIIYFWTVKLIMGL